MKNKLDIALIILALLISIASLVVFVILINSITTLGFTTLRLWGMVSVTFALLLSMVMLTILVLLYKQSLEIEKIKSE